MGCRIRLIFADLFPFAGGDREGRKPFISGHKVQAYVMASNNKSELGDHDGKDLQKIPAFPRASC